MPTLADISDRSQWLSASATKKKWRLTDEDLETLPFVVTTNPRGRHLPPMRLFHIRDAKSAAYNKWGGAEGFRAHNLQVARANATRAANNAARRGGRGGISAAHGVQRGGVQRRGRRGPHNPAAGRPPRQSQSSYWASAGPGRTLGSTSEVYGNPAYELDASWDESYDYNPDEHDYIVID